MLEALDQRPFKPEDGSPGALYTQRYASSAARLTRLVLKRQFLLNKRDRAFYIARTLQVGGVGAGMSGVQRTAAPAGRSLAGCAQH